MGRRERRVSARLVAVAALSVVMLVAVPVTRVVAQTKTKTTTKTRTPTADIRIAKEDFVDPVASGDSLTYFIAVANAGPSSATNVTVTDNVPVELVVTEVTPVNDTPGGCTWNPVTRLAQCQLGSMAAGRTGTIAIYTRTTAPGSVTNTAVVNATEPDPNRANNSSTQRTTVTTPGVPEVPAPPNVNPVGFVQCVVRHLLPWGFPPGPPLGFLSCRPF